MPFEKSFEIPFKSLIQIVPYSFKLLRVTLKMKIRFMVVKLLIVDMGSIQRYAFGDRFFSSWEHNAISSNLPYDDFRMCWKSSNVPDVPT